MWAKCGQTGPGVESDPCSVAPLVSDAPPSVVSWQPVPRPLILFPAPWTSSPPLTLPMQAYGPSELEWFRPARPVWAWVGWPDGSVRRVPGFASGANDRVVLVSWETERGTVECVVWRNAVTVRGRVEQRS